MTSGLPIELLRALSRRVLLLDRGTLEAILAAAELRRLQVPGGGAARASSGYYVVEGVAVIPMIGVFLKRGTGLDWLDSLFGIISTEDLGATIRTALEDPAVNSLLFQIDSGGGEARGVFDLADLIYAARGQKPMLAVADEWAFSAAYLIASAADQVVMPRTGGVGSIGVYATRLDVTALDQAMGVRVEVVTFGDRKADGNPHVPVSDAELADLQAEVDRLGNLFVDTVARNRGLTRQSVLDTEARAYGADDAMNLGLVDDVGTFSDAVMELATMPADAGGQRRTAAMAEDQAGAATPATTNVVDFAAEKARLEAAGREAGRLEERQRVETITDQCVAARHPEMIVKFVGDTAATPATVARELAALRASEDEQTTILGMRTPGATAAQAASLSPEAVYARRRQDVERAMRARAGGGL